MLIIDKIDLIILKALLILKYQCKINITKHLCECKIVKHFKKIQFCRLFWLDFQELPEHCGMSG